MGGNGQINTSDNDSPLRLIIYFLNIYKKTRAQSSVSSLRISGGSDSTIGGFAFRVED